MDELNFDLIMVVAIDLEIIKIHPVAQNVENNPLTRRQRFKHQHHQFAFLSVLGQDAETQIAPECMNAKIQFSRLQQFSYNQKIGFVLQAPLTLSNLAVNI